MSSIELYGCSIEAVCCDYLASVPSLSLRAWQVVCCGAALQPAAPVSADARASSVLEQGTVCLCCPLQTLHQALCAVCVDPSEKDLLPHPCQQFDIICRLGESALCPVIGVNRVC